MRNSALQERRNRQILADIVRTYIETGEPVSSRAISKGFEEALSTATIRNDMLQKLATERERYEGMAQSSLTLCDPAVLGDESALHVHVEGAAQIIGAAEFVDQAQLRDLLAAIEEKHRLVTVLNACIETPEPVHVQIGVREISEAGDNLALISAAYTRNDLVQGSLGVLGPTRMHYERAMTAVAYVAQLFSEALSKT